MQLANLSLPPGVDRISAAEFRALVSGRGVVPAQSHRPVPNRVTEDLAPLEHDEQVALVRWLRMHGIRHNATPNGGHRAAKTAKYLKAEGVAAGFPDITVWPEPGSGLPVLHVEMKRTRGGRATAEQLEWRGYLNSLPGHVAEICEGASEAIRFICETWEQE